MCGEGRTVGSDLWTSPAGTVLKAGAKVDDVRSPLLPRKSMVLSGKAERPSSGNSWEFGYLFTHSFGYFLPPFLPSLSLSH